MLSPTQTNMGSVVERTNFKEVPRAVASPSHKIPILEWWEGFYDKVFIALNPFFRLPSTDEIPVSSVMLANGLSYISSKEAGTDNNCGVDYDDYAKAHGEMVSWSSVHQAVCPEEPFKKFALCTWISSCLGTRHDVPPELQGRIKEYCASQALFLPTDDMLSPVLEPKVGEFLRAAGVSSVDQYDEFRTEKERCDVELFTSAHPTNGVRCIHSPTTGLIMDWQFDGVEGIIGLSARALEAVSPEDYFEGFYADENTYSDWLNPRDFFPREA